MNLTLLSHSHIIIAQLRPSHPVVELPKKKFQTTTIDQAISLKI